MTVLVPHLILGISSPCAFPGEKNHAERTRSPAVNPEHGLSPVSREKVRIQRFALACVVDIKVSFVFGKIMKELRYRSKRRADKSRYCAPKALFFQIYSFIAARRSEYSSKALISGLSFLICSVLLNRNPAFPALIILRSLKLSPEAIVSKPID